MPSKFEFNKGKMVPYPSGAIVPDRDLGQRPALECIHLGIEFGGLKAVDDFSLTIGKTEIAGLIGPNGAGKTNGLQPAHQGVPAHARHHPSSTARTPRASRSIRSTAWVLPVHSRTFACSTP